MKPRIVTDISNIAHHYDVSIPKVENIKVMYNTLKFKYWVIGIADWDLFRYIDYPESYKYYLARRIVIQAPPSIPADILLINEAVKSGCLILTNDKLREYEDLIPSKSWLKSHRVSFDILDGEFITYLP